MLSRGSWTSDTLGSVLNAEIFFFFVGSGERSSVVWAFRTPRKVFSLIAGTTF